MDDERLLVLLRKAVRAEIRDEKMVSVAYSGGVDSSVIAAIAKEACPVRCFTCAVEGSFDATNAAMRAEEEGLRLTLLEIDADDLRKYVASASEALGTADPIQIAYSIPTLKVLEESHHKLVLAGNGADELFGGYSKYLTARDPRETMDADIEKMLNEANMIMEWAASRRKRAGFPFIREEVREFSATLPLSKKIDGTDRKVILRDVARLLGLPSDDRPKKAAQYSSGVLKLMRGLAREEGMSLADWTDGISKQ
jgi:asparagine synthase (glutamine-hydrolysing)